VKKVEGNRIILLAVMFIFIFSPAVEASESPFYRLRNLEETETEREDTPPRPDPVPEPETDTEPEPEMDTAVETEPEEADTPPEIPGEDKTESTEPEELETETAADTGEATVQPEDEVTVEETASTPPEETGEPEKTVEESIEPAAEEEDEPVEIEEEQPPEEPFLAPLVDEYFPTAEIVTTSPPADNIFGETAFDTGPEPLIAAAEMSGPSAPDSSFMNWEYILGAGLFLFLLLIIWWKRRPRKVKVYYDSTTASANQYFQEHFTRHSALKKRQNSGAVASGGSREKFSTNRRQSRPVWKYDDEQLEKIGIDPRYREVLRLYYSRGLPEERIAKETGFGSGEIGLVIDLSRRLREEAV